MVKVYQSKFAHASIQGIALEGGGVQRPARRAQRGTAVALISCLLVSVGLAAPQMHAQPVEPHAVQLPHVSGPIAETPVSHAFDSARYAEVPADLGSRGYVEEEYLLSGSGEIYEWPAAGRLEALARGPYTTRILVRRPADKSRFSGAVVVEPFNSSLLVDLPFMWYYAHEHFMERGDIWIGVTIKPVSVQGLKRFDPHRYGRLSLANPLAPGERCADQELGPGDVSSEVGFAFDILGQLGALVRTDVAENPLHGYRVNRVYMTGISQTGGYVHTYLSAVAPLLTRDGGGRIYDGYLQSGNPPFNVVLNGCAKLLAPDDPRLRAPPVGVPVIEIASEGDTLGSNPVMRRPDSDQAPDLYRRYEIAGAAHTDSWTHRFYPNAADYTAAGGVLESKEKRCPPVDQPLADFPVRYAIHAIWENLDAWVVRGTPAPRAERLLLQHTQSGPIIETDREGNALGGVRSPFVDVPTAVWGGHRQGGGLCNLLGYEVPFSHARLKSLYSTHAVYARRVAADVQSLLGKGWLTRTDAEHIRMEANAAEVP